MRRLLKVIICTFLLIFLPYIIGLHVNIISTDRDDTDCMLPWFNGIIVEIGIVVGAGILYSIYQYIKTGRA